MSDNQKTQPQSSDSKPASPKPKSLLEQASDRITARLNAAGIPEKPWVPSHTGNLQVTFVPRRKQK